MIFCLYGVFRLKKCFALLISLLIVFCSGCVGTTDSNQSEESISSQATSSLIVSQEEKPTYESIKCFIPRGFKNDYIKFPNDSDSLCLSIPNEWYISTSGSNLLIKKHGKTIGSIKSGIQGANDSGVSVYNDKSTYKGVTVNHNIYEYSQDEATYEHVFNYTYKNENSKTRNFTLRTPYEEISKNSVIRIVDYTLKFPAWSSDNIGVMKLNDNRKKILILGNSFISTSSIGATLQEMCGDAMMVEAVSIGMANVSTHTADPNRVKSIADGNYSAVFMCGFFSTPRDVPEFGTIVNACKNSNTKLAIFPAHNEQQTVIDNAVKEYSYPILLDWKAEINGLITEELGEEYFCINDYHKHSTPLAGFVGAHLIYRAIFGKTPNINSMTFSRVSKSEINKLGNYTKNCSFPLVEEDKIYVIGK